MFTSPPAGAGAAFRWRLTSRPLSPAAHARTFCVTESAWRGRSAAEADAAPQQHRHAQYAWPPSPTWRHFLRRSFDPRGKTPKIGSVAALPWALSEPLLRPTQESSVALPRSVGDGSSSAGPRNPTRSQCPGLRKSQTLFALFVPKVVVGPGAQSEVGEDQVGTLAIDRNPRLSCGDGTGTQ